MVIVGVIVTVFDQIVPVNIWADGNKDIAV
jgi:hypothetical protein